MLLSKLGSRLNFFFEIQVKKFVNDSQIYESTNLNLDIVPEMFLKVQLEADLLSVER